MILKGISVNQDPPTKDYLWITPKGNTRFWNQSTWMSIGGSGGTLPVIESSGKYLVTTGTQGNFSLAWSDIDLSNYISGTIGYAAIFNSSNSITNAVDRIRVGDGIIEWDSTNGGFKIYNANSTLGNPIAAGIYADWVSALGANSSGGGGGGGGDLDWSALVYWDEEPEHIINKNYLPYNLEYVTSHPYYAVEEDSNGKLYVNVNWHDTTYSAGTGLTLSGFTLNHSNSISQGNFGLSNNITANSVTLPYVSYDGQGHISAVYSNTFTIGNLDAATVFSFNTKIPFNNLPNLYVGYTKISGSTNGNTQLKGISKITHATTNNDTSTAAIEWDQTNNAWHFYGGIYSDSFVSALGLNSSGGGSSGNINYADLWQELESSSSEHYAGSTIINSTHLPLGYTQNNKNYPIQANNNKLYVNVPWTDTTYKLSLNGTQYGSGSTSLGSFYAPTEAGTNNYVLKSNSSGIPIWVAQSSLSVGSASKLTTARKTYVTLGTASTTTTRDWSEDTTIPVSGVLSIANGGTGSGNLDKFRLLEKGTLISATSSNQKDFNDYTDVGTYYSDGGYGNSTTMNNMLNKPSGVAAGFKLIVEHLDNNTSSSGYLKQTLYIKNKTSYTRTRYYSSGEFIWTSWIKNITSLDLGSQNRIVKFGNNTFANSIIYENNNKIGINDSSPDCLFTVSGDARISNNLIIGTLSNGAKISWDSDNGGLKIEHVINGQTAGLYADWISAFGANNGGGSGGGGINWADFWNELNYTETHEYGGTKIIDRRYLPINGLAANSSGQTFYAPTSVGSSGQYLRWPSSGNTPYWDSLDAFDIPNLSASKINSGTFDVNRIPNLSTDKLTSGTLPISRGGIGRTTSPTITVNLASTSTGTSLLPSSGNVSTGITGALPIANGGTGATNAKGAEYNILSNASTALETDFNNTTRFAIEHTNPSASNGILVGYRTASQLWSYIKGKMSSDSAVNISGNATTATILQTTRTINGTNFNGSANITTSTWGTARNISISDADGTNTGDAVSVNGSENKTLKLPSTIKASLNGTVNGYSIASTINSGTANRLAYYTSSGIDDASTIYASNTKLAINSTTEPSQNLYVNGTSFFNSTMKVTSTGTNKATLELISNGDYPIDLKLGRSNTAKWSLTSRNNSEGDAFYLYSYIQGASAIYVKNDSTLRVGIGTNTPNSDCKLHVVGNIYATGGVTALQAVSSDKRLKKNIKKFNAKDIIDKLNPVSFEWNSKAKKLSDFKDGTNYGLIAQDSDGIIDNLVFDLPDGNGYKGVRYEKLIPILLQAVKEQQKEIDELKQIIKKLKV